MKPKITLVSVPTLESGSDSDDASPPAVAAYVASTRRPSNTGVDWGNESSSSSCDCGSAAPQKQRSRQSDLRLNRMRSSRFHTVASGNIDSSQNGSDESMACCCLCERPRFDIPEALRHGALCCSMRGVNPLRLAVFNLVQSRLFEALVLVVIVANCALLAYLDPSQPDSQQPAWVAYTDIAFATFFTFEMLLKIFALGFVRHHGAYFRDAWNRLDAVIVVLAWLNFIPDVGNFSSLRTLRLLRPLRSLNAVKGLKTLVVALLASLQSLWPVLILSFVVFSVFAIVGTQIFSGDLRNVCQPNFEGQSLSVPLVNASLGPWVTFTSRCRNGTSFASPLGSSCATGYTCLGGDNPAFGLASWDDSASSLLIVFTVMTLEDWPQFFRAALQTSGEPAFAYFFFLIVITAYFIPNLAAAIINLKYHEALEASKAEDEQERLIELQHARAAVQAKAAAEALARGDSKIQRPESPHGEEADFVAIAALPSASLGLLRSATPESANPSATQRVSCWLSFRNALHRVTLGYPLPEYTAAVSTPSPDDLLQDDDHQTRLTIFGAFIVLSIVLNTLLLAAQHHNQPMWLTDLTDVANKVFVGIFAFELLINITAVGFRRFFSSGFYLLDLVVVASSVLELLLVQTTFFSVLRALRLLRVLKLLRSAQSLQEIVAVTLDAVSDAFYLNIVLMLILFIFTLSGMQFFAGSMRQAESFAVTPSQPRVVVRAHFDDLLSAFLTVFQVITTDNWVDIMWVAMATTNVSACAFFIILVMFGYFVMSNLFLSILIQKFAAANGVTGSDREMNDDLQREMHLRRDRQEAQKQRVVVLGTVEDQLRRQRAAVRDELNPLLSELAAAFENVPETALAMAMGAQKNRWTAQVNAMPITDRKCGRCGTFHQRVLPAPPFRPRLTEQEFHDTHCWRSELRQERETQLYKMLGLTMEHMKNGTMLTDGIREIILQRAQQRGFFTSLTLDDLRLWSDVRDELHEELDILALALGEEQLGRAHIAYVNEGTRLTHDTNGSTSFFIFGPQNGLRVVLTRLTNTSWYSALVMFFVVLSCAITLLDSPGTTPAVLQSPPGSTYVFWADFGLNCAFALDIALRMIALGFILHPGAFMRDPWNWLDLVTTVVSFASDFSTVRVLRIFRFVRPLRSIRRFRGLALVTATITQSLAGVAQAALLLTLCYLVFGIFAVQAFGGKLYSCSDPSIDNAADCVGTFTDFVTVANQTTGLLVTAAVNSTRTWRNSAQNFDNILSSVLTLAQVSTGDDWTRVMYSCIDARSSTLAPQRDAQPLVGLFFVFFYVVSNFFLLNLVVGVVIVNFNLEKSKFDGLAFLTAEQRDWVDIQRAMLSVRPEPLMLHPDAGAFRRKIDALIRSPAFDIFIAAMICLSVVAIGMEYDGQSSGYATVLYYANLAFVGVFFVEMVVKMTAYGVRYFRAAWHRFDCFLALLGVAMVILQYFAVATSDYLPINLSLLRVLRFVRILRVLRLFNRAKKLRILVETLWHSLPSLLNVTLLTSIIFVVFAVIGVQSFAGINTGDRFLDDQYLNFGSFYSTLQLLFIFMTNQQWAAAMYDVMESVPNCEVSSNCGTPYAPIYFLSFIILLVFVVTNVFLAIILDNFGVSTKLEQSSVTQSDLHRFTDVWARFDPDASMLLATSALPRLLEELQPPLGVARRGGRLELLRRLVDYRVVDHCGRVHYAEVLVPLARHAGPGRGRDLYGFDVDELGMSRQLRELPVVLFEHTPAHVGHSMSATMIAASYRRYLAGKRVRKLRSERSKGSHASPVPMSSAAAAWIVEDCDISTFRSGGGR